MEFTEINIEKVEADHYLLEVFWENEGEEWTEVGDLFKARFTDGWVLLSDGEPLAIFSTLEEAKQRAPELLAKYSMSFKEEVIV